MQEPDTCNEAICTRTECPAGCALEVIDSLLRSQGNVRGEEVDALLDLRFLINRRQNAEAALALFCSLRRSMEARHYLAFYRLRRWMHHHIVAEVCVSPTASPREIAISVDRYCLEALRSRCVLAARRRGEALLGSRVSFRFAPLAAAKADQPALATA